MKLESGSPRPIRARLMYGFSVLLAAQTASFREPSAHLYQKTYPLPPISTIAGIAGAACGLEFSQAWRYLKENNIYLGVTGICRGTGIDLWRYNKIAVPKSKEEKEGAKKLSLAKILRNDILNREFLYDTKFSLYYAAQNRDFVCRLAEAFKDPGYAISLGNSDDIAMVRSISEVCDVTATATVSLKNTAVAGEISKDVGFDWDSLQKTSVSQTLRAPMISKLIVDFEFKDTERKPINYQPFTFLFGEHILRSPQPAYSFCGEVVPLYCIGDGQS